MAKGLSLANKVLLLFGALIVGIIGAALVLPWIRMGTIVEKSQLETSRHIARLWEKSSLTDLSRTHDSLLENAGEVAEDAEARGLRVRFFPLAAWDASSLHPIFTEAREKLRKTTASNPNPEFADSVRNASLVEYQYARFVRDDHDNPVGVIVVTRRSPAAATLLLANRAYLIGAWIGAGALAIFLFWFVTSRIILSPVRKLRDTAEVVQGGNLNVRADIHTGDEFEQLSDTFNDMLEGLSAQQQQLKAINKSLDMRLNELAQRNTDLFDAARQKGEFLAAVSHELRTPLNSIIGFAELLQEVADAELEENGETDRLTKRRRYLGNIVNSGRSLLEMINELLTMAKIDAGKLALQIQPTNIAELCSILAALIRPLVDRKSLEFALRLQGRSGFVADPAEADLPMINTDPQKLQQIIFNFLSNAVKFTPEGGRVELRVERLSTQEGPSIRISVLDSGPGIPKDQHTYIFKRFSQLDAGHARTHQGTGLGLAIAKEFAAMLKGQIHLESDVGRGAMFSFIVPVSPAFEPAPEKEALTAS